MAGYGGIEIRSAWASAKPLRRATVTELDAIAAGTDVLPAVQPIARRHDDPTADGRGAAFERLVELWQPALLQADR